MVQKPKTAIEIDTNERPAVAGLKRLVGAYKGSATELNAVTDLIAKGWGLVSGAIGGVLGSVKEAVQLAAEQERVELRAIAAIRQKNQFSREEFDLLQAANAERQKLLGIGDEAQLQLQGTLALMGVQKNQLSAVTDATIGLAGAFGLELAEAGKKVGKVLAGNFGELAEFGIQVKNLDEAQAALNETWLITQAQTGTLTTRLTALDAAYGDFKEVLGGAVNSSTAANNITQTLTDTLVSLTTFLASPEGRGAVNGFFQTFASGLSIAAGAGENLVNVWDFWRKRFTTAFGGVVVEQLDDQGRSNIDRLKAQLLDLQAIFDKISAGGGLGGATPKPLGKLTGLATTGSGQGPSGPPGSAGLFNFFEAEGQFLARLQGRVSVLQEYRDRELEVNARFISAAQAQSNELAAIRQNEATANKAHFDSIITGAVTALASLTGQMAANAQGVDGAVKGIFGGLISTAGQMISALGSAALAAALGSTAIPWLAPIFGGPAGIAASAGIIAAGGLLQGLGGRLSSAGRSAATAAASDAGAAVRASGVNRSGPPVGAGPQAYAVNLIFNGPVGGSPRAIARSFVDLLNEGGFEPPRRR